MAKPQYSLIEQFKAHRSIRKFQEKEVERPVLEALDLALERTASACALYPSSVIKVTDQGIKQELARISAQPFQAFAPHFWVFLVDAYRAAKILEQKQHDPTLAASMDTFFQGYSDALLCAQSVSLAAQSLGLGTCFLGSILNNPQATIDALELPKYTFPVLGLVFGYSAQEPQIKPHLPVNLRSFENKYQRFDDYSTAFSQFDQSLEEYYSSRLENPKAQNFTNATAGRMLMPLPKRKEVLQVIQKQGFDLRLD